MSLISCDIQSKLRGLQSRGAVIWLLWLSCAVLLTACDDPTPTSVLSKDETVQDPCAEAYWLLGDDFYPSSPPPWATITSIASWREVTESELLYELWYGADVRAMDEEGRTMLHWAARCSEKTEVIEMLLKHRADVNARTN